MLDAFPRPTIFAHRGSSSSAPENTISAFELALAQGADAIELDVQLSADESIIVMHDSTVERTTNGISRVSELTLTTLKQLDAGEFFDSTFRGERIPTLEEVFEAVGKELLINIELKPFYSLQGSLPRKVAQAVQHHHMEKRVIFSSFDPLSLWQIKHLLPEVPCGLLALSGLDGWVNRTWLRRMISCEALHPHYSSVTSRLVSEVHRSGQRLFVYTVNEPDVMAELFKIGVDGIITDYPQLARKVLDNFI